MRHRGNRDGDRDDWLRLVVHYLSLVVVQVDRNIYIILLIQFTNLRSGLWQMHISNLVMVSLS